MSPAHPSALITPLDAFIWLKVDARMDPQRKYRMHTEARQADRRDAELVLFQMRLRNRFKPRGNYIRWMDLHPGADWRAECL